MTDRAKILGCIREALSVPAPAATHGEGDIVARPNSAAEARRWLPAVGGSFDERLALFQKNATALKATFRLLEEREAMRQELRALSLTEGWKKLASHRGELVDFCVEGIGLPVLLTDQAYDARELEACSAAITECDALVAQTGSVLVTSRSAGGRALSVLPPHHVVVARREQLVAELPDALSALKRKYGDQYPSFISFITGPSRTGDIERILVLGAHGPKKLTILAC